MEIADGNQIALQLIQYELDRTQRAIDLEVALGRILRMHIMQLYIAMGYTQLEAAGFTACITRTSLEANNHDFPSSSEYASSILIKEILNSMQEDDEFIKEQDLRWERTYPEALVGDVPGSKLEINPAQDCCDLLAPKSSTSPKFSQALEYDNAKDICLKESFEAQKTDFRLSEEKMTTDNKIYEWRIAMMENLIEKHFLQWFTVRDWTSQVGEQIRLAKERREDDIANHRMKIDIKKTKLEQTLAEQTNTDLEESARRKLNASSVPVVVFYEIVC